jgi:hypothetical protein
MMTRTLARKTVLTVTLLGVGSVGSPAWAGGVGDFLSPAFGTSCTNHHGTRADGMTTQGTGAGNGNLAGLPIGSPANQCGGADMPTDTAQEAALALNSALRDFLRPPTAGAL